MVNGFVYVIESPGDRDLLDGRTEGRSLCEVLRLADIPHWYSLATTRAAFVESMTTRLGEAVSKLSRMPILHLSMHGDGEGVQLTDGGVLSWADLRQALNPITNAMSGKLLVCMSSCQGASGIRMAMHSGPDHPFWALVGSSNEVLWSDAAVGYITFYHSFFKGLQLDECVSRMKIASGDNTFMMFSGTQVKADWEVYEGKTRQNALIAALRSYGSRQQAPLSGGLLDPGPSGSAMPD